jgi:hypothetical protein
LSLAHIIGNTVVGNWAVSSFGGDFGGGISISSSGGRFANNIVAFNSSGILASVTVSPSQFLHNCVYGNSITNYSNLSDPTGVNGNISEDPRFVDPHTYRLGSDSPCIDAGLDSVIDPAWRDIDGEPRRQGARVDIGCYEYTALPVWERWIPDPEDVSVTVTNLGGISYAQISILLRNDCRQVLGIAPLARADGRFILDFSMTQAEGINCAERLDEVSHDVALGGLIPGDYGVDLTAWGTSFTELSFVASDSGERTLVEPGWYEGAFKFRILGLPTIDYVVLTSTNLIHWVPVHTNRGGGLYTAGPNATEAPARLYQVRIDP